MFPSDQLDEQRLMTEAERYDGGMENPYEAPESLAASAVPVAQPVTWQIRYWVVFAIINTLGTLMFFCLALNVPAGDGLNRPIVRVPIQVIFTLFGSLNAFILMHSIVSSVLMPHWRRRLQRPE